MAGTYTQIHIQAVFAVSRRECLIAREWKSELYRYITGIIQKNGHKLLAINGISDHVHIFFGMRPAQSLSGLLQDVKGDSTKWINSRNFIPHRFSWQEGYGAFSYSKSDVSRLIGYVDRQEMHHRSKSFITEYREFLDQFQVEYDERYLFYPVS
jgi:REP element-mobilizing transposase RayT